MALAPGVRLGPYEILAPLGAGGMGEVYRARDTRLDRTVAIKILPEALAADPQFRERFDREARVISQLDHPHICALYDVGHANGTAYLVMQYLEGETLAGRLQKGALPIDQVVQYGTQIAEALARAHRAGIVHRDLKPANVMLTKTGARLMDFGLAKTAGTGPAANGLASLPTTPAGLTAQGTIVGTFPYMAPEQIEGSEADARSDIWALGCVLYEMVTGQRAFSGKSQVGVLSAILDKEPEPVRALRPAAPPELERLITSCLEKDPERRWQSAYDLAVLLHALPARSGMIDAGRGTSRREAAAWSIAIVALLVVLGSWLYLRPGGSAPRGALHRTSVLPPPGVTFSPHHFAVSPDGTRLAFAAFDENGRTALWIRSFVSGGIQQLPDTDDAQYPFWAPDSGRVGFFARGQLRVADLATGAIRPVVEAPSGRGAAWNRGGDIVYAPTVDGPLLRVSEHGGPAQQATRLNSQRSGAHRWPWFLPDGRRFLFVDEWGTRERPPGLYAASLDGGEALLVSTHISGSVAYGAGHLLYVQDGNLMAQPFDVDRLTPSGVAVSILQGVLRADSAFRNGNFSVSASGVLAVQSLAESPTELVRYIGGQPVGFIPVQGVSDPTVSPDGRLVAFSSTEATGRRFIRVHDLDRGVTVRVTERGAEGAPVWSRDGRSIAYQFEEANAYAIYEAPVHTPGPPQLLLEGPRMTPADYSPDGRRLAFMTFEHGAPRIAILDRETKHVSVQHRGAEFQFHPDGQWVTFIVLGDMYLARADGAGPRITISSGGAAQGRWGRDGRHLYYLAPDRKLMEVPMEIRDGQASVGTPRTLFQTRIVAASFAFFQYDIRHTTPPEFIVNSLRAEAPLTFVSNWLELLPR